MDDEAAAETGEAFRRHLDDGGQTVTQEAEAVPTATTLWTTNVSVSASPETASEVEDDALAPYAIASVSILVLFCVITLACNAVILASVSWIRRPMSPTLSLSISLAAADAYNALFLGTGLIVNSLLPRAGVDVKKMAHGNCIMLGVEALRVGGIFVSVAHLLALAVNHYLGILRPLHYAATFTPKITSILIVVLWKFPIAFFFVYFSSISEQGFQSANCEYHFMKQLSFRAVFSCLFFAPLVLMAFIYLHIYCIVRRTQCSRQRSRLGRQLDEGSRGLVRSSGRDSSGRSRSESCRGRTPRARQLARNWKAVVTTMLILGTYILGWIPAVMLFLLVCDNCVLQFNDNDKRVMLAAYSFANLLIILKSLSDPIIYAARMQEIKAALARMKENVFGISAGGGSGPAASGADSNHGYGTRVRRRTRNGLAICCCCRTSRDLDHGYFGGDVMSRNRLSTYASTASGGAPATSNMGLSFRVRSLQRHALNGRAEVTGDEILAEVVQVRDTHGNEKAGVITTAHRVTVI